MKTNKVKIALTQEKLDEILNSEIDTTGILILDEEFYDWSEETYSEEEKEWLRQQDIQNEKEMAELYPNQYTEEESEYHSYLEWVEREKHNEFIVEQEEYDSYLISVYEEEQPVREEIIIFNSLQ